MNFPHKSIREEAAKWFLRLHHADSDHPDRSKFESWLMQSASHQEAYKSVSQAWQDFDSPKKMDTLAQAMQLKKLDDDIKRRSKTKSFAKVASIVALSFCALFGYQLWENWQQQPLTQVAQSSQVGHIASHYLSDGTHLTLDAHSNIEVIYYRNKRLIKLKQGQAVFNVVKDQDRPFVVESANARITVMGTRFLVNMVDQKTYVAVDHGKVQVQQLDSAGKVADNAIVLTNGQVAEFKRAESAHRLDRNAYNMFAFTKGELVFEDATLNEVAETISRYRSTPVVSNMHQPIGITAVLKIKEIESFIKSLPEVASVTVKHSATKTELNPINTKPSSKPNA
jgi:transmembrane sensor